MRLLPVLWCAGCPGHLSYGRGSGRPPSATTTEPESGNPTVRGERGLRETWMIGTPIIAHTCAFYPTGGL